MKFKDFAQILHFRIGNGKKNSAFILELFDNIVENGDGNSDYNPVSHLADDTLDRYYSGSKDISKEVASKALAHLDKEKFKDYLYIFSIEALEEIKNSFQEKMAIEMNDIAGECTEIFVSILRECTSKSINRKNNDKKKEQSDKKQPVASEDIPEHRDTNLTTNMSRANEEIFDFFNDAIYRYNIKHFIESIDPTDHVLDEDIDKCEQFINLINDEKWMPRSVALIKETNTMIQKVKEFSYLLNQYTNYVGLRVRPLD